jgi:PhoH-like ATPase
MPLPKAPTHRADTVNSHVQAKSNPAPARSVAVASAPAAASPVVTAPPPQARLFTPSVAASVSLPARIVPESIPPAQHAPKSKRAAKASRRSESGLAKLFVLDTNVLMHDPMCLFRFEEHDVFLPMVTLEELDGHKKGMTEVARNARQVSRSLDALAAIAAAAQQDIVTGLPLNGTGYTDATGRLFFQTQPLPYDLPASLPQGKADNQILGVVHALAQRNAPREVVLVSKDINMRIKSRALGLAAEDYENDKALGDDEVLYAGTRALPADFWATHSKGMDSFAQGGSHFYRLSGPVANELLINQFVHLSEPGEPPFLARVTEVRGKTVTLKTIKDFGHSKHAVWGVMAKNREQNFAMNLLMDPEVDFVTLAGTAGTGKTLMALACGLAQVLEDRRYSEIIVTRATVSVGEDIGFLPGTEEEKMGPWMGALDDNLEFLGKVDHSGHGEWGRAASNDILRSRIKIKSMNFMRGRTFMNKWVIIDEAQNLTPKQMKTLITRAGPGTKIVCMGNLAQIDTPYLTEGSSGLTYAVDRFKGWAHGGHVTLARGERSRLADFASEVL